MNCNLELWFVTFTNTAEVDTRVEHGIEIYVHYVKKVNILLDS